MPQTQHEWIMQQAPKLTEDVIVRIVDAEKKILKEAATQARKFPYKLTLANSHGRLASEEVGDSARQDAIIAGQKIDGPSWKFTASAQGGISLDTCILTLESEIEPLVQTFLLRR